MAIGRGCIFDVAFSKIANKQRFLLLLQHSMYETILTDGLTLRIPTPLTHAWTQLRERLFRMFFIIQIADMLLHAPGSRDIHVVYIPSHGT